MRKRVLIILAPGFEEIEAVSAIDILRRADIEVIIAGLTDIRIKGSHGITIIADKTLSQALKEDFDACVLPGGSPGAKNLASSEEVNSLIKQMSETGKIIAAICAAPAVVLAPLGILRNKTATCYPGMQENFNRETTYKEEPVVIDGNIITSRGPGTALSFALAIVEKLSGKETYKKLKEAALTT